MDLKEIKQIINLMTRSDLSEFSIEEDGLKLRIRRGAAGSPAVSGMPSVHPSAPNPAASPIIPVATTTGLTASSAGAPAEDEPGVTYIKSPMVGTFYRAPSPESPPFVDAGTRVSENTPVCIIEAMKIMNEIQAEVKGTIIEIQAENGQPVEFGQRLFKIQLA